MNDVDTGRRRISVTKDMAISHSDFFRILPLVLGDETYEYCSDRNIVSIARKGGKIEIYLSPERQENVASLRIPRTQVELRFENYSREEAAAFLENFNLRFQRGGG